MMPWPNIDPLFPLLPKPGAYMITHIATDRKYIGISKNVKNRVYGHFSGQAPKRLGRAIKKYGKDAFSAQAICYSINLDTAHLVDVEAGLIKKHGTVGPGGFNIKAADGGIGPYGPEFGAIIRDHHAVPENRARMLAARAAVGCSDEARAIYAATAKANWADPEIRKRMVANIRASANSEGERARRRSPEALARLAMAGEKARAAGSLEKLQAAHAASLKDPMFRAEIGRRAAECWRDENYRAKRKAGALKAWCKPERRVAVSAAISGRIWVNNGIECRRIRAGEPTPNGFVAGRLGGRLSHLRWMTDGVNNKRVLPDTALPLGWRWGATQDRSKVAKQGSR